jgi:hypothetical protein
VLYLAIPTIGLPGLDAVLPAGNVIAPFEANVTVLLNVAAPVTVALALNTTLPVNVSPALLAGVCPNAAIIAVLDIAFAVTAFAPSESAVILLSAILARYFIPSLSSFVPVV